jgi:pSer/pThr/pTyr-binding forkhead associated (FHA) protein
VSEAPIAPERTEVVAPEDAERLGLAHAPAVLVLGGTRHELKNRIVTIGRSHECDIAIRDPNVSRRHCEIRQEEGGYVIVDLGSTNGIEVNGARVQRARLEPRDRIVVGTTELTFEGGG